MNYNFKTLLFQLSDDGIATVTLNRPEKLNAMNVNVDMATGRALETLAQSILINTEDHKEGIKAFREKRSPKFEGK